MLYALIFNWQYMEKYIMQGYSMERFDFVNMDGYRSILLKKMQKFADDILKIKHRYGTINSTQNIF